MNEQEPKRESQDQNLREVASEEIALIKDADGLEKLKSAGAEKEELVRALLKIAKENMNKAEQIASEYANNNSAPEILDAFHDAVANKNK